MRSATVGRSMRMYATALTVSPGAHGGGVRYVVQEGVTQRLISSGAAAPMLQ